MRNFIAYIFALSITNKNFEFMNCTTKQLIKVTKILSKLYGDNITSVEFEDGSGWKVIFKINAGKTQFVDLSNFKPSSTLTVDDINKSTANFFSLLQKEYSDILVKND